MLVKLLNLNGETIVERDIPEMEEWPQIIRYGGELFQLQEFTDVGLDGEAEYTEVVSYYNMD